MGTNYLFKISEYYGRNCYIPSDGKCFIKCYIFWRAMYLNREITNEEINLYHNIFNDFLFNENRKDRKGIMSNARFSKFNTFIDTKLNENYHISYYNKKDRHFYPKQPEGTIPSNYSWYNYFHKNSTIGHYCLIN